MRQIILIFVLGLVGSNYPMKGEALALAPFSSSAILNTSAMQEVWKDIRGYEGLYQVSSLGRVKSTKSNRILKFHNSSNGYFRTTLYINKDKKNHYMVSRIVAINFIPNPDNKATVNHINGIKTDNRIDNLEWATFQENVIHAYETGLTSKEKQRVYALNRKQVICEHCNKKIDHTLYSRWHGVNCKYKIA